MKKSYLVEISSGSIKLWRINWKTNELTGLIAFDKGDFKYKDEAYVVTNLDNDKAQIVLYDFKNNKVIKEVFSTPDYDVSSMARSRKRNYEIDYFAYEGEKYTILPK
jgi:hypothetical protein